MEISIFQQTEASIYAFLLGILCWGLYELIKLLRMVFCWEYSEKFRNKMSKKTYKRIINPTNNTKINEKVKFILLLVFDILYFIVLTNIFSIFIYIINGGVVRWYIFAFALFGFTTVKVSLGKVVNLVLEYLNYYINIAIQAFFVPIKGVMKRLKNRIKQKKTRKITKKSKKTMIISYGK